MNTQFAIFKILFRGFFPIFAVCMLIAGGCATAPPAPPQPKTTPTQTQTVPPSAREHRTKDYVIVTAISSDTYQSLARTYLGNEKLAYLISEFNRNTPIQPGAMIVVPLKPVNPGGVYPDGYQTVPVLCYHRITPRKSSDRVAVTEEAFEHQMAYLKHNGYTVLTLKQFLDFIDIRRRPPKKSVLITIDDGWKSTRTIAYPILKKYGFTAVIFLYTAPIGSAQNPLALNWDDVRVLRESGVFEIGSHSVSHGDLNKLSSEKLLKELKDSQRVIADQVGVTPNVLAYPFGIFNENTIAVMQKLGYRAGFTVIRGGNPFFNNPFSLNRSMVYNSDKLDYFIKLLETFRRE
ncbi:MAG: polysaccharide deacetylase family protein [Desulfuromonadales bacterium]|nr:polysaccharide deacetylase family protein [Desulfuromonadales bacterium]